jgi:concanavalin A-like lectin/glucanase superfamily protein
MSAIAAGWSSLNEPGPGRLSRFLLLGFAFALLLPGVAQAQPFGTWGVWTPGYPTTHGYINIPHSSALNPAAAFTFEAWVNLTNSSTAEDCRSIAGKDYLVAWWVGQCTVGGQSTLRTYLKGVGSLRQGGIIPRGVWTHIAVVFNGTQRLHYINGELAASFAESGPLPPSTSNLRIGSDSSWPRSPTGGIDEVRLWNVARTTAQIRSTINVRITTPQPGLVAVWPLDGNGNDIISTHDGTVVGTGLVSGTFPVMANCGVSTAAALCLNTRFQVIARWRTNPVPGSPVDGNAQAVLASADSGIFTFFSPTNWEVMVKVLNGCGLNSRYWVFSAATTNVFYRMEVFDVARGAQKIYFNYPGPPAPAVTDVSAFATCP